MSSMSVSHGAMQRPSPRDMLQSALTSSISSGSIKAEDKDALSTALDSIDNTLKGSRPTGGGKPPSPGQMQEKVESLIDDQVEQGNLTEDQASELKQLFSDVFSKGPGGAGGHPPGGPGGPGGTGGPPPGPPPGEDGEEDSASALGSTGSSSSSAAADVAKMLQEFMKQVLQQSGGTTYGSSGQGATTGASTSGLLDVTA